MPQLSVGNLGFSLRRVPSGLRQKPITAIGWKQSHSNSNLILTGDIRFFLMRVASKPHVAK